MSSTLESFCDCYLNFIFLAICLSVKKQRRDSTLESTKQPKTLDNSLGRYYQDRPHTTWTEGSHLGKARQEVLLGTAFPNVFLSAAHISEYVQAKRRPQKWKIERREKNPLRQRSKVNFKESLGGGCLLEFDKGKK